MTRLRKILTAFSLLCAPLSASAALAQPPAGPAQMLLVDRSGSMRGFFDADPGQMGRLEGLIRGGAGDLRSFYFIDEEDVPTESGAGAGFGNRTVLEGALERALRSRPKVVWFVTDNQSSANGETESDRDLATFYATLRSDRVKRLCFFPLKLQFDGDLYRIDDSVLAHYQGRRGLLVYALLLDEGYIEQYEKSVAEFEAGIARTLPEAVRRVAIKPLERETVTAKLISLPGSNLRVEGNTVVGTNFDEGQIITGKFGIELESNFGMIKIDRASIDARGGGFRTSDFSEPNPTAEIDPEVFVDFRPGHPPPPFTVTLTVEPVQVETTWSSIWHSIGLKRGDINGDIFISITVPPSNFRPVEALESEFSTDKNIFADPSPKTQERIYRISELMQRILPQGEQRISPRINDSPEGRIPVRLSVRYLSGKRALYLILPALALLLLNLLLFWLLRRARAAKYRLTWSQERYRPFNDFTLTPLLGRQEIRVDDVVVASIRKKLSGIEVSAQPGYAVDDTPRRQLNEAGSYFTVGRRRDERSVDFHFSRADGAGGGANSGGGSGWGGDFEDPPPPYDDGYDPTPPAIKMPTFGDSPDGGAAADGGPQGTDLSDLY